jgi:tetratricopeptide (TPR) repeat protein
VQLGHRLAVAVEEQLFPSTSACVNEFRSKDPLASLAFARAMQSVAEQKWTLAVNLLQTVLDIEPDNDTVQLQYLTALANAGMETAIPLGQRLLKAAKDEDDIAREAAANLALGQAYYSRRAIQAAEYHLDEALKLGVLLGAPEWLPAAYQFRSTVALFRNDVAKASEYLQRLRDICDESGNQIDLLGWMSVSAWLSTETGDLVRAAQYARTARNLSIKCGLMGELVNSTIRLGDVSAEQGLFGEALEIAEEALDIAMRQGVHFDIVNAATLLAWLNFEVRKSRGIMDVLAQLDEVPDEHSLTTLPASPIARAFLAACLRDHSIAAREWRLVISLCEQLGAPLIEHRFVPWLADALTLAGRKEEARLVLEEARERLGSAITILQESSILHSEALQLLMAGHRAQALEWLLRCVEVSQSGEWHSLASIDAAWLSLEEGESLVAKRLTRSLGPWLDEHPAGLVLKARMSFADRFFAAANNAQKRYFNVIQCPPPDYYLRLDELYQAALEDPSTSSLILPLTPSLPSRM